MNLRLTKYEKTAGAFVGVAAALGLAALGGAAIKNGWFARTVGFTTALESADGVHAGTLVRIAGLRAGQVSEIDFGEDGRVTVRFDVFEKFAARLGEGSRVQLSRPFVLGDKVLEVSADRAGARLAPNATIPVTPTMDLIDVLTDKKMGAMLASFDHLADSLAVLSEAFADPRRSRAFVRTLDRLGPTLESVGRAAGEVGRATHALNEDRRAEVIAQNLATLAAELGRIAPGLSAEAPQLGQQLGRLVTNLDVLAAEVAKVTPELPRTGRRAAEALDETVVLLKAMQKSFLFRGGVREVLDEEKRKPAGE